MVSSIPSEKDIYFLVLLVVVVALETDVLVGISLAGIAMTVIFVIIVNFFVGRKENKKPKDTTVE